MDKSRQTAPTSTIKRQPELNVIYFVDSNKTRSFTISLVKLRWLLAGIVVVFVWAIAAIFIMDRSMAEIHELEDQVSLALERIFDYQIRHDDVYQEAYPEIDLEGLEEKAVPAVAAASTSEEESEEREEEATATAALAAKPLSKQQIVEKVIEANVAKLEASKTDAKSPAVSIDEVSTRYTKNDEKLWLKFAIKNESSPTRATGVVYGIATYITESGARHFVGSPQGISVDSTGYPQNPDKAFNYSIKYYKVKRLSFARPVAENGKFSEIKVSVTVNEGEDQTRTIPLSPGLQSEMVETYNKMHAARAAKQEQVPSVSSQTSSGSGAQTSADLQPAATEPQEGTATEVVPAQAPAGPTAEPAQKSEQETDTTESETPSLEAQPEVLQVP